MSEQQQKEYYALGFMFIGELNTPRHVTLIKKARPAWQAGKWNGVGGKLNVSTTHGNAEASESPLEAMVREFREETGVITERDEWRHRATLVYPEANVFVFSAFRTGIHVRQTTDEPVATRDIGYVLRNAHETVGNLRWLIPLVLDRQVSDALIIPCRWPIV